MFGSTQNKSVFGSSTGTGFGTGGGLFGNQGTGGFGSTGTPFGASTPASSASLFGAASTNTSTNLFGSNTSAFGQANTTAGAGGFSFGGTQPSGGLFGQQTSSAQTPSLFGTPQTQTAFGAAKTPGFGASTSFGGASSAGGLFGSTPSAFGAQSASTGSTLFGGFGAAQQPQSGTTMKFQPPAGSDTMVKNGTPHNIHTRHQCITAMKEYESKSLEELRVEDYLANRKGPQAGSAATTGLFGASTSQASSSPFGSFGSTQKPTTGFGFGAGSTAGLFGSTAQTTQTGSLFGQQNKSLFGTPTTTTTATATPSLFGSAAPSSSFSFGAQNTQNKSVFGTPASTQSTSLFGSSTPAASTGFSFGSTSQPSTNLFGSKPASTPFGSGAASSGGLSFGSQPATSNSIFGKPATSTGFGAFGSTSTGATFGQTNTTSLFGQKPAGTGFGTSTSFGGLGSGSLGSGSSLFSNQQQKPTFGFGTTSGTTTTGLGGGLGGLGAGTSSFGFGSAQPTALGQSSAEAAQQQNLLQQQLQALVQSPYGDSPLFRNLKNDEKREEILRPTNPGAQKASLNESSLKITPGSSQKIKPRPLHPLVGGKSQLFDGLEESDPSLGLETFVCRKSVKKLVIRPSIPSMTSHHTIVDSADPTSTRSSINNRSESNGPLSSLERSKRPVPNHALNTSSNPVTSTSAPYTDHDDVIRSRSYLNDVPASPGDRHHQLENTMAILTSNNSSGQKQPTSNRLKMQTSGTGTIDSSTIESDDDDDDDDGRETPPLHPANVTLRRHGYYTIPSLDELRAVVDDAGNCYVQDLTIGREGYGSVFFPGPTNLANMNLDEIVHFRRKEITVYPDDDRKPPVGEGLNKKAEVTLDCVWPNDKTTQSPIKSVDRLKAMDYTTKIETTTARIGAKFIDYRPETGSWVFEVKHFSKYGLLDDSDDENSSHFPEKDPKKLKMLREKTQEQQKIQRKPINLSMEQENNLENIEQQQQQQQQQPWTDGSMIIENGLDGRITMDEDTDMVADTPSVDRAAVVMDEDDVDYVESRPSSHRLAVQLGVNPQHVQVMKASFFGEHEDELELAHASPLTPGHVGRARPRTPIHDILDGRRTPSGLLQSRLLSEPRQSEPRPKTFTSGLLTKKAHAPSPQPQLQLLHEQPQLVMVDELVRRPEFHHRPVTITDLCQTLVPVKRSRLYNRHHLLMDAGCYRNRAHRPGWATSMTFTRAANVGKDGRKPRSASILPSTHLPGSVHVGHSPYQVQINRLQPTANEVDKELIVRGLEICLDHCNKSNDDGGPRLEPRSGVDALHQFSRLFNQQLEKESGDDYVRVSSRVWNLCVALWGRMPGYDQVCDESSYEFHVGRREAFQHWLSDTIQRECGPPSAQEHYLSSIVRCLCGDRVSDACDLATKSGDYRLALILSQVTSGHVVKQMVEKQMEIWKENQADEFIEPLRLKIYAMLAGLPVWHSTSLVINTCEGLSWKQALSLHLLHHCQSNAPISTAFNEYVDAFKGRGLQGSFCAQPLPEYLDEDEENSSIKDTCYHLIKLYCKNSHRLERTLAPTTSTSDHLDYRLSWHLYQVLSSLGYSHLSSERVCQLHTSYAAQLEAAGLWHWAVFVLLHLHDQKSRESAIRDVLMRHVTEGDDDVTAFLTEKLNIPAPWIHHAKAIRAGSLGNHGDEAWHYLQAGMMNRCHEVVIRHLAADCIINERYAYLMRYLESLARHQTRVHHWATRGGIYHDFIRLTQQIKKLTQTEPSIYDLEQLEPDVLSLTRRISDLDCVDSKDRLCQSEIADRTANLLRILVSFHSTDLHQHPLPVGMMAPHIGNLPMPEDYSLRLLRSLTETYITEVTS